MNIYSRIEPCRRDLPIPLTDFQRIVWSFATKQKNSLSKRTCITVAYVRGPLDITRLQRSVEDVVKYHEPLRTTIASIDGVPWQRIEVTGRENFDIVDASGSSLSIGARQRATDIADEFVRERVDLSVGPLFKARLIKISRDDHMLILALHQVISDFISNAILLRDIWHIYSRLAQPVSHFLLQQPIQLADYAIWQRRTRSCWLSKHDNYWRQRVAISSRVRMPIDEPLPDMDFENGEILSLPFGYLLSTKLRDLARQEKLTLPLVVLAVYVFVMSRWCDRRDLVIFFPEHGRHLPELQNLVGCFLQLFVLRIEVCPSLTVRDLLRRVTDEFCSACDHRDLTRASFSVEEAIGISDLGFNWVATHGVEWSALAQQPDTTLHVQPSSQPYPIKGAIPSKRFEPIFVHSPEGINLVVAYQPDLIGRTTIESIGHYFRTVADEFTRDPSCRLESVSANINISP